MQTPQKQSKRLTQNELALTQAAQKQENYSCQMQEVHYPRRYCLRGLASGAPASVAAPPSRLRVSCKRVRVAMHHRWPRTVSFSTCESAARF